MSNKRRKVSDKEVLAKLPFMPHGKDGKKSTREELKKSADFIRTVLEFEDRGYVH